MSLIPDLKSIKEYGVLASNKCRYCDQKNKRVLLDNNNRLVKILNVVCEVLEIRGKTLADRYKRLQKVMEEQLKKQRG